MLVGAAFNNICEAQSVQNPQPIAPAIQSGEEAPSQPETSGDVAKKLLSNAALRFLFFAPAETPRVTIAVEVQGAKPKIVASALPPWRGTSYMIFPSGKARAYLLSGNVVPSSGDDPPSLAAALTKPLDVDMKPGTTGTVLISESSGRLNARLLSGASSTTGYPNVTIINGGATGSLTIRAKMGTKTPEELWISSMGEISESPLVTGPGSYSFILSETVDGVEQSRMVYQSAMSQTDVITLIVHQDRYGRTAMTALSNRITDLFETPSEQAQVP